MIKSPFLLADLNIWPCATSVKLLPASVILTEVRLKARRSQQDMAFERWVKLEGPRLA